MDLNYLRNKAYQTAKDHGWHDKLYNAEHWAMLILTEIGEAVQADRNDKYADLDGYKETYKSLSQDILETTAANRAYDFYCKNTFEDELADICIRTLDMAGIYRLDLSDFNIESDIENKNAWIKRFSEMSASEWGFMESANIVSTVEDGTTKGDLYHAILSVFLFAKAKNINLQWFIENKMLYNESRPYRHGGKKY